MIRYILGDVINMFETEYRNDLVRNEVVAAAEGQDLLSS